MNSSSAYSNVLNTSPVAPTVNSAPKRDLSDENSSNEFQQTLQNVRADMRSEEDRNTRAETVKTVRNAAPKKAQSKSDDQQQAVENDQAQSTKAANTKTPDSKKTGAPKKATDDADEKNTADEQNIANQGLTNTPVDDKVACANSLLNAGIGQLVSSADGSSENLTADASEALATETKTISVGSSVLATTSSVVGDKAGVDEAAVDKVSTDKVDASLLIKSDANIAIGENIEGTDLKVDDKDANNKAEKSQLVAIDDASLLKSAAADVAAALTASIPASNVANTNPTADAQAVLSAIATDSAKIIGGAKTLSSDTTATATLVADDQQASSFFGDTKNGFEKMLQAMVTANAGQQSQDSSSTSSSNIQSSSAASTPAGVIESFARTIDSQTPAARGFVVQTSVPVTVGQPQWSQAVGEKVLWLAAQNVNSAEIRLDPPDLGPMQVKVSVNQDQTNVSFTSHHPIVREVLDQNLHRLRDMFNEQGLNLGSVDVSDKSFSRQQGEGKGQQGSGGTAEGVNEDETPVAVSTIMQQRLVDHYA